MPEISVQTDTTNTSSTGTSPFLTVPKQWSGTLGKRTTCGTCRSIVGRIGMGWAWAGCICGMKKQIRKLRSVASLRITFAVNQHRVHWLLEGGRDVIVIPSDAYRLAAVSSRSVLSINPTQLCKERNGKHSKRCVVHDPYNHHHKRRSRCQHIDLCLLFATSEKKKSHTFLLPRRSSHNKW